MRKFLAVMVGASIVSFLSGALVSAQTAPRPVMMATCYSDGTFSLQSTPK